MNDLWGVAEGYLAIRRSLGYKLEKDERLINSFIGMMESQGATIITAEITQRWLMQKAHLGPGWRRNHLTAIRLFAQYCRAMDSRHEVPPTLLAPSIARRPSPYIYSRTEIRDLIRAARQLLSDRGFLARTYATLFGLLDVTGARSGEVIALNTEDVDLQAGIVLIRNAKFGKSRLVPLHESTCKALQDYIEQRDAYFPKPDTPSLLVCHRGKRLDYRRVVDVFHKLSCSTGLRTTDRRPRLHDFRHTFVVRTVIGWYRAGQNVEQQMPLLSTLLGHRNVSDTYWYLSACPELLELASARIESAVGGLK